MNSTKQIITNSSVKALHRSRKPENMYVDNFMKMPQLETSDCGPRLHRVPVYCAGRSRSSVPRCSAHHRTAQTSRGI